MLNMVIHFIKANKAIHANLGTSYLTAQDYTILQWTSSGQAKNCSTTKSVPCTKGVQYFAWAEGRRLHNSSVMPASHCSLFTPHTYYSGTETEIYYCLIASDKYLHLWVSFFSIQHKRQLN